MALEVGAASSRDSQITSLRYWLIPTMESAKGYHRLRKGRCSIWKQCYLLTTVVIDRKPLLEAPETAMIVMDSLKWLERDGRILLDAVMVMPEHFHFVARLEKGSLNQLMHSLKSYTANRLNERLCRKGRFWQPQYHDHAVRNDEDFLGTVLYCLNNPVRRGIVADFHDYPYWYCRWKV